MMNVKIVYLKMNYFDFVFINIECFFRCSYDFQFVYHIGYTKSYFLSVPALDRWKNGWIVFDFLFCVYYSNINKFIDDIIQSWWIFLFSEKKCIEFISNAFSSSSFEQTLLLLLVIFACKQNQIKLWYWKECEMKNNLFFFFTPLFIHSFLKCTKNTIRVNNGKIWIYFFEFLDMCVWVIHGWILMIKSMQRITVRKNCIKYRWCGDGKKEKRREQKSQSNPWMWILFSHFCLV